MAIKPPVARFVWAANQLAVNFDGLSKSNSSKGAPLVKGEWSFGDGQTLTFNSVGSVDVRWRPSHTYSAPGTYNVSWKVWAKDGQTNTVYGSVAVTAPPPESRWFTFITDGLYAEFDGENGAGSWTFGDGGSTAGDVHPDHTYASPGDYAVTYTVSGISVTRTIKVTAPYSPVDLFGGLQLQISQDPGEQVGWNRLFNPNGQYGASGWKTPATGGRIQSDGGGLRYTAGTTGQLQPVYSEPIRVSPGRYAVAGCQFLGRSAGYVLFRVEALDAAMSPIDSQQTGYISAAAEVRTPVLKIPSAGRYVRLAAWLTRSTSDLTVALPGDTWSWSQAIVATSLYQSEVTGIPYQEGQPWLDVLGPTHSIDVVRSELDVSTLTASILDADLDPAASSVLSVGARCRLRSVTDQGGLQNWEPLFTGRVSQLDVAYGPTATGPTKLNQLQRVPNGSFSSGLATWGTDLVGVYYALTAQTSPDRGRIAVTSMPTGNSTWGAYVKLPLTWRENIRLRTLSVTVTDVGQAHTSASWQCYLEVRAFNDLDQDLGGVQLTRSGSRANTQPLRAGVADTPTTLVQTLDALPVGTTCVNVHLRADNTSGSTRSWTTDVTAITLEESWYSSGDPTDTKAARITLEASDDMSALADTAQPYSVATIAELPELLEASAVPYLVNGSADQISTATKVADNESAALLDQVVIARDNEAGIAWVSRDGVFTAWSPSAPGFPVFDEGSFDSAYFTGDVYSDIEIGFNTDEVTNSLTVKWQQIVAGETVETQYGPYQAPESIVQYGIRSREITYAGTDPSVIAARAAAFLAANSTPRREVSSLTVPIRYQSDLIPQRALIDLMAPVGIIPQWPGGSIIARVREIKHSIVARNDRSRWTMTLGFRSESAAARAIPVTSPPVSLAADVLPYGQAVGSTGGATQTLTTAVVTKVTDTVMTAVTTQGGITWSAANDQFTVPKTGIYLIHARVAWAGNATGNRLIYIYVNGANFANIADPPPNATARGTTLTTTAQLTAGDTVELRAYQNSGGNLNLINNSGNCGLSITYLGV